MAHLDEYKKRHSCETQLTTLINDWVKILDSGEQIDTFVSDFAKAFDAPPHECKLFDCGIGGKTLEWIASFLCYRQQRVVVNGAKSAWAPALSGVPPSLVPFCFLYTLNKYQQTLILK